MMELAAMFFAGVGFTSVVWLVMWVRHLLDRLSKLEDSQKKHLPYRTAEELEHAMAAMILLESEANFKRDLIENAMAHLRMAREDRKGSKAAVDI